MANGLYYYKLVSDYPNDVTKNCKLTVNEIDSNFYNLKSDDIASADFIRDEKVLVLTRRNGEKLIVDLSSATYDFNVNTEENASGLTIVFNYDGADGEKTFKVENIITSDNIDNFVDKDTIVLTDGTLKGKGNIKSPLGIRPTELTGMYAPVKSLIDTTKGESLPLIAKLGTRYITKEYVSDYGLLYNGFAVKKISAALEEQGKGWRVPTKADWDKLLNSVEPCNYKNHDSARCHVDLGKYAGKLLKSECGWLGQPDCTCNGTAPITSCTNPTDIDYYGDGEIDYCDTDVENGGQSCPREKDVTPYGVDSFGFRIMPSGIATLDAYGNPHTSLFREKGVFWTSTHVNGNVDQDVYAKIFECNKSTVSQVAECPMPYYSLRLVKDYDGSNYYGAEYIDGVVYETILHPESGQIWLESNFCGKSGLVPPDACDRTPEYVEVNGGLVLERREEFFVHEWNGKNWDKKLLKEGDTIVIENPTFSGEGTTTQEVTWTDSEGVEHTIEVTVPLVKQNNLEYRVYTSNENCDRILVNTNDLSIERVVNIVVPMIEAEREERITKDEELANDLREETTARIVADEGIIARLTQETNDRISGDTQLWDAIIEEASARTTVEAQIWDAIAQEYSARTDVDNQIWEAISQEYSARTDVDSQLWDAIAKEYSARTDVDNQIWEALNNEIERATEKEDEIEGQLIRSDIEYIMKACEGLLLMQKNGNSISVGFDGNFGEI